MSLTIGSKQIQHHLEDIVLAKNIRTFSYLYLYLYLLTHWFCGMSSSLLKRKLEEDIALSDSDNDASTELDDNTSVDSAKNRGKKDENNDEKDKKKEEEVLLQVTKRPRMAKPFTEELLTSWDGMKRIYEEFPMKCRFNARGSEAAYLWRLLGLYKEWAFQLHPGLAFNDILRKTETLGARGKVRVELSRMRDIERDRFIVSALFDFVKYF